MSFRPAGQGMLTQLPEQTTNKQTNEQIHSASTFKDFIVINAFGTELIPSAVLFSRVNYK